MLSDVYTSLLRGSLCMDTAFLSYSERSYNGPKITKDEWDFSYIVMKTRQIVEKYGLAWDPSTIIVEDSTLLESIFLAAKELILQTGLYNITTSRIIEFSEDEIVAGMQAMNRPLVMGEGAYSYILRPRNIEDSRPPAIWGGNPGCPTQESLFYPLVKSVAQEPIVDLVTCGSLINVDGFNVKKADPTEVAAVVREMEYVRKALNETGRPGMGVLGAESSISQIGDLAVLRPDLLRPTDSHLIALLNELITDQDNLVRAAAGSLYGIRNASLACTMVGGLGGDAPGATVLMAASMMAANLAYCASYHLCHPIHINQVSTTAPGCLWTQSALCQTFATFAPAVIVCDIWPKSGAMTKELLYEVAANAIVATVSGGHLEGVGTVDGNAPNCSGLEVRLMGEVGRAVAKQHLSRSQANEMVLALVHSYEKVFSMPNGNPGKRFDQVYDIQSLQPKAEWQELYEQVKEELRALGLLIE